jgi:hypothetical protein
MMAQKYLSMLTVCQDVEANHPGLLALILEPILPMIQARLQVP